MTIQVELDHAAGCTEGVPEPALFTQWVALALAGHRATADVCVRIVSAEESAALNAQYRHLDKPTNVLSFPSGLPEDFEVPILGDLAICAEVVAREAAEQGKPLQAHWAHMVIHGTLHLLGFDHMEEEEAAIMEAKETLLLAQLGFANPYE